MIFIYNVHQTLTEHALSELIALYTRYFYLHVSIPVENANEI